jgi:hypothetical protein
VKLSTRKRKRTPRPAWDTIQSGEIIDVEGAWWGDPYFGKERLLNNQTLAPGGATLTTLTFVRVKR